MSSLFSYQVYNSVMTKDEIVSKVKRLSLPMDSYVVFGSCPMAAAGLREANDIDLLVSEEIYEKLKKTGWKVLHKGPKDEPVVHGIFEAHQNWDFSPYSPTLKHLLASATIVDGIPFASLKEVRKWKAVSGPKHLPDLALIDNRLKTSK